MALSFDSVIFDCIEDSPIAKFYFFKFILSKLAMIEPSTRC